MKKTHRSVFDLDPAQKEEYIRKYFNRVNNKELARATGWSERWVYKILKNERDSIQVGMFE